MGTKKKDLFNKGEPKQKVECPNVQPVSKSLKEPTRKGINELANQLDDARNDAEQLEDNSKTGSKLAAGRCMSMITEEFFLQEFEDVNNDHVRFFSKLLHSNTFYSCNHPRATFRFSLFYKPLVHRTR